MDEEDIRKAADLANDLNRRRARAAFKNSGLGTETIEELTAPASRHQRNLLTATAPSPACNAISHSRDLEKSKNTAQSLIYRT